MPSTVGILTAMGTPSRSRGRPPVPLDRIIATATAILDEQGAKGLSMRALAQRLDSGTATLYRHFSGRPELIAHVVDAVVGEAHVDDADLHGHDWREDCETILRRMFDVLCRHPRVAHFMVGNVPLRGPNMVALREQALGLFLKSGFTGPQAVLAWSTLARYVLGFAVQLTSPDEDESTAQVWTSTDLGEYPATRAVDDVSPVSLDSEFAFGLELLIEGLNRRVDSQDAG